MTHDTINAVKSICSVVLRTLENGFKFSFYFVNLLQFYKTVRMFSAQSLFIIILAKDFCFHVYNIISFLGEVALKSGITLIHEKMSLSHKS